MNPYRIGQNGLESIFGWVKRLGGTKGGLYGCMISKVKSKNHSKLLFPKRLYKGTKAYHYRWRLKQVRRQSQSNRR